MVVFPTSSEADIDLIDEWLVGDRDIRVCLHCRMSSIRHCRDNDDLREFGLDIVRFLVFANTTTKSRNRTHFEHHFRT